MGTTYKQVDALDRLIRRVGKQSTHLRQVSRRFSLYRTLTFFVGLAMSILCFYLVDRTSGIVLMVLTLSGFGVLAHLHNRIEKQIVRYQKWLDIKVAHRARILLDWEHIPEPVQEAVQSEHPFGADLDITGRRSLHHLIDTAISEEGSRILQDLLLQTRPEPDALRRRQLFIGELASFTLFRDKLALYGALFAKTSRKKMNGTELLHRLSHEHVPSALSWLIPVSAALAIINLLLIVLANINILPNYWIASTLLYATIYFVYKDRLGHLFEDARDLEDDLRHYRKIFLHIETSRYHARPHLMALLSPYLSKDNRPSLHIAGIGRLVTLLSLRENPLLWFLLNAFLPWDFYFAHRFHKAKSRIAALLPLWLDTWFELEALCSLANFASLHPGYTSPLLVEDPSQPVVFDAQGLGHPLISEEQKITNDIQFTSMGQVALITGSNMAGKSTFLKTMGINLVLAYAGAPVNARLFRISLFRLYTCIKVSDSIADGLSYFYAEIRRLRALLTALEQTDSYPLFFLIDEIFRGTNNRERLIGSKSFIRALTGSQGIGAVTTHDLELVKLADELTLITNYHFREEILERTMVFDYILHPGPCPTTNALKLMRMEGLPVDERQ